MCRQDIEISSELAQFFGQAGHLVTPNEARRLARTGVSDVVRFRKPRCASLLLLNQNRTFDDSEKAAQRAVYHRRGAFF
jgi:hypothetical protein